MLKLSQINDDKKYCKILVRDPKIFITNPITWIRKPKNRFFLYYGFDKLYGLDIECYLWNMNKNTFLKPSDYNGFLIEHILKNERL